MPEGLGPRFALEAGFLILLAAVAAYARLSATEIILVMAGGWLLTSIFEVLAARRERLYPDTSSERRVEIAEAVVEPEPKRRRSWFRRPAEAGSAEVEEPLRAEAALVAAEELDAAPEASVTARETPLAPEAGTPLAPEAEPELEPQPDVVEEAPSPVEAAVPAEAPAPAEAAVPAQPPPVEERVSAPHSPQVDDEATGEITPAAPRRRWFRRARPKREEEEVPPMVARPSARHVRLIRGAKPDEPIPEDRKDAEAGS